MHELVSSIAPFLLILFFVGVFYVATRLTPVPKKSKSKKPKRPRLSDWEMRRAYTDAMLERVAIDPLYRERRRVHNYNRKVMQRPGYFPQSAPRATTVVRLGR